MLREEAEAAGTAADAVAALSEPSCLSTFISGERTLSQCFEVFSLLHRLLSTLPAVARVTREVIADFAADEVVYLELRTTPRALAGRSKRDYVQTVVDAIRECEETSGRTRSTSGWLLTGWRENYSALAVLNICFIFLLFYLPFLSVGCLTCATAFAHRAASAS
jgi:adenosine deaminase